MRRASILLAAFVLAAPMSVSDPVNATGLFKSDRDRGKIYKDSGPRPHVRGFRATRPTPGGYQYNYQPLPSVVRENDFIMWSPYVDNRTMWERVQHEDSYP